MVLLIAGLLLTVFAYAGRTEAILAVAGAGVVSLLAGVGLLAVAVARSVSRRVERPTIAATVFAEPDTVRPSRYPAADAAHEDVLCSFGPFGVDVCEGPYAVFRTWHRKNDIVIELTRTRLRALPNRSFGFFKLPALRYPWGVRLPFEIPYSDIVSLELRRHPSPVALMEVLYLRYRSDGGMRDVSIACFSDAIERAYQTIVAVRGVREGSGGQCWI